MRLPKLLLASLLWVPFLVAMFPHSVFSQTPARDFSKETSRPKPAWIQDAVIYEIFPRTFSAKGNFAGVTEQLDRLKTLGVDVIWLMPIHPIGEVKRKGTYGSPYAVKDYYAINPDYGTAEDFKKLVREAHQRGLKVIIDIVANHTGWDSVMMKNPEFYVQNAAGQIISPYPDWTDVADLNYDNPKLRDYMTSMLKYWLQEFDLDGFRCDVAGFVPTSFWDQARVELEKVKPNLIMLAEWDQPDLLVKAFDIDYAWPFHKALDGVLTGKEPATLLRKVWETERNTFPAGSLHLRFSDNHDERRAIVRFGEHGALAAQALMFTLDGVPLIYNGMEVGDTAESGAPALFEKLPIFWQIGERRPEFARFYHQIVPLRKKHAALRQGETIWLQNSDESHIVSYLRRSGGEEFLVVINFSNRPFRGFVEVNRGNQFEEVTPDLTDGKTQREPIVSLPTITLDPMGFRIFRRVVK